MGSAEGDITEAWTGGGLTGYVDGEIMRARLSMNMRCLFSHGTARILCFE